MSYKEMVRRMDALEKRVADLTKDNAALKAELASLKEKPKAKKKPVAKEGDK